VVFILEKLQPHIKCRKWQVNPSVLIPGDLDRADYIANNFFHNSEIISENKEYRIYNGEYSGKSIAVCPTGIGAVSSAVILEELIETGAKHFIRVGTCGALSGDLKPGDIVIATGAVRGEGTSKEYIDVRFPAVADFSVVGALASAAKEKAVPFNEGIIRTHDAFYIESPLAHGNYKEKINIWSKAGVYAIENESATLFVIGALKHVKVGSILVVAGNLATSTKPDPEKVKESVNKAIEISCDAMVRLQEVEQ
jgi:uridine phosphorylase